MLSVEWFVSNLQGIDCSKCFAALTIVAQQGKALQLASSLMFWLRPLKCHLSFTNREESYWSETLRGNTGVDWE